MSFRRPAQALAGFAGACIVTLAWAQAAPDASLAKAQDTVKKVCSACHGSDGNSQVAVNPRLAGQHADYLLKQLTNFKPRDGRPAERANPVMAGMVATLSPDDMRGLAAYYSTQKPQPQAAHDPKLVKLGQSIYRGGIAERGIASCAGCHGPSGAGIPAQYPRLAGQHTEYTAGQLKAFRSGERQNDANRIMRDQAARLSDREIAALAEFLTGLR